MVRVHVRSKFVAKSGVNREPARQTYVVLTIRAPNPLAVVGRKISHARIRDQRTRTAVKKSRDIAERRPTASKPPWTGGVRLGSFKSKSEFQSMNPLCDKEVIRFWKEFQTLCALCHRVSPP